MPRVYGGKLSVDAPFFFRNEVLGRCSYSSRGTDLVSSVSVPLGGALKK